MEQVAALPVFPKMQIATCESASSPGGYCAQPPAVVRSSLWGTTSGRRDGGGRAGGDAKSVGRGISTGGLALGIN